MIEYLHGTWALLTDPEHITLEAVFTLISIAITKINNVLRDRKHGHDKDQESLK